jgi:hypothetical protein
VLKPDPQQDILKILQRNPRLSISRLTIPSQRSTCRTGLAAPIGNPSSSGRNDRFSFRWQEEFLQPRTKSCDYRWGFRPIDHLSIRPTRACQGVGATISRPGDRRVSRGRRRDSPCDAFRTAEGARGASRGLFSSARKRGLGPNRKSRLIPWWRTRGSPISELLRLVVAEFRASLIREAVLEVGAGIGTGADYVLQNTKVSELFLVESAGNLFPKLQERFSGNSRGKLVCARGDHATNAVGPSG